LGRSLRNEQVEKMTNECEERRKGMKAMKAMVIVWGESGGKLELRDIPKPEPGPEDLLIQVKVTSVNRADIYQLQGTYDPRKPPSPGSFKVGGIEAAGVVADMGKNVSGFALGDRVMAMCDDSYAEFVRVNSRLAIPVPERLSWEEAASIPLGYMTEHNALITCARMQAGEAVLIHGVAAGVGVAAVQIAKLFGASPIMGTDSPPDKLKAVESLGMDIGIDYRTDNFADAVLAATNGNGADVIIDHVGGPYLQDNLRCMAVKGRLVSVGRLAGGKAELDLDLMALKRLELIGVTFRTRTLDEKSAIVRAVITDLIPALADGRLRPVVKRVFPLDQIPEAQEYMTSNVQVGKVVIKV
jgi:NADPH2:quinone reductase